MTLKKRLTNKDIWALTVGMVISGQYFGWNYGFLMLELRRKCFFDAWFINNWYWFWIVGWEGERVGGIWLWVVGELPTLTFPENECTVDVRVWTCCDRAIFACAKLWISARSAMISVPWAWTISFKVWIDFKRASFSFRSSRVHNVIACISAWYFWNQTEMFGFTWSWLLAVFLRFDKMS